MREVYISPRGARAAVTIFSTEADNLIKFSGDQTTSAFEEEVDHLPYWGSTTRIDRGLEAALEKMFQEENGMRSNASRNLIIMTDGQQSSLGTWEYDAWREKFNEARIRVIVIGFGNFNRPHARHLVNDENDIYEAKDFSECKKDQFIRNIDLCGGRLLV